MALIDLNNFVKPKQTNYKVQDLTQRINPEENVYTDLHLDLNINQSIGIGVNAVKSFDLLVDTDINAIKNSIRNILTTRKGQKILNPVFGCSLDQYLFLPLNDVYARAIGDEILTVVQTYEPRIEVLKIVVTPNINELQYEIKMFYRFLEIKKESLLEILAKKNGEIII